MCASHHIDQSEQPCYSGHFGSATVSYFRFMRWLMFLNLFLSIFMASIVLTPFLVLAPSGTDNNFAAGTNSCESKYHFEAVQYSHYYEEKVDGETMHTFADYTLDALQGTVSPW